MAQSEAAQEKDIQGRCIQMLSFTTGEWNPHPKRHGHQNVHGGKDEQQLYQQGGRTNKNPPAYGSIDEQPLLQSQPVVIWSHASPGSQHLHSQGAGTHTYGYCNVCEPDSNELGREL